MRLSVAIIFYGDYWHMTESLIATVQKTINHPQIYSALCLTSNEEMSGFLRRELAQRGDGCLPPVLSLSRLAVAARQYPHHSLLQLKDTARLIDVVAANRRPALVGYLRRLTGGVIGGLWYPIGGGISAHYGRIG